MTNINDNSEQKGKSKGKKKKKELLLRSESSTNKIDINEYVRKLIILEMQK